MGREIVYCNRCGLRLTVAEFEKGRAATILGKNYCRNCAKDVKPSEQAKSADKADPRESRPAAATRPPGTTRSRTIAAGKAPLADRFGFLPRDPTARAILLIGGAVILIILVTLVVVLSRQGRPG